MKPVRKRQLVLLFANGVILLAVFLSLYIYDTRFRTPPAVYKRLLVEMKKDYTGDNPYFGAFDRMDLFSQFRGTRAVGAVEPDKMVILIPHPSYDRYFHFSHLLYEAYRRSVGLVILDFGDVRHFIPLSGGEPLDNDARMVMFVETMIAYMRQFGFSRFRIAYLGRTPDSFVEESGALSAYGVHQVSGAAADRKTPFSLSEEVALIDDILEF